MELTTKFDTILAVINKAKDLNFAYSSNLTMLMDLELAIDLLGLDIQALLDADYYNFMHDFYGIKNHIDRQTKSFDSFWSPRHTIKGAL